MGRVRLQDIARRAGVSVATVSKILKGPPESDSFRPERVRRVRATAEKLGYTPNYLARALQAGRSKAIGMALPRPEGEELRSDRSPGVFWSLMTEGIDMQVRALGYHFVTIGAEPPLSEVDVGLRFLREGRIDALVLHGFTYGVFGREKLREGGLPVVLTHYDGETALPVVALDDAAGIEAAVRHLAGLGHRRIAWLGPAGDPPDPRRQAFRRAARALGLETDEALVARETHEGPWEEGYGRWMEAARRALIERFPGRFPFTGLACWNECLASGAYAAAFERGMRIPRDVSVVGFDDIHAAAACPQMTVASHMLPQVGRRAAQIAIEMASGPDGLAKYRRHREKIPSLLVVRKSTGPAPA